MKFRPPEICPVCGEDVPPKARACPGCGADERAGWNEDAEYLDGVDLPEAELPDDGGSSRGSYDAFMEREFGVRPGLWRRRFRVAILLLLVIALAISFFLGG